MLTMPRPKWIPSDEQRQLIAAAVCAYRNHAETHAKTQQAYVQALTKAAEHDVAISALAEALGVPRKAVYRLIGRPMK